ncbi:MAG: PEGA domain-containing protein [bacterium]|nr:PEGA domain-containing protein [bacterium]
MPKLRVLIFLSTILVVGVIGVFASYYARGYRFSLKTLKFLPNGILVVKSEPDGASVYINGELKTATNATVFLSPGTYDLEVKREGFFAWQKRIKIDKEVVTQASVSLFKNVPSLSPITFEGALNPVVSPGGTKIAFMVPDAGLYTIDAYNLPLGFSKDPKKVVDGNLTDSSYIFSPDSRQILLTTSKGIFLIDSTSFTSQAQLVNVAGRQASILKDWEEQKNIINDAQLKNLPPELSDILARKTSKIIFSPDDNMILYTASGSSDIAKNLIPQLPGASTQKEERDIKDGRTYVYDIKEDRNFLIFDQKDSLPAIRWLTTSKHLLLASEGKVIIMDYDGTNRQEVYKGAYISPFAFPFANATKLLILTNLGGGNTTPNLYTLTTK